MLCSEFVALGRSLRLSESRPELDVGDQEEAPQPFRLAAMIAFDLSEREEPLISHYLVFQWFEIASQRLNSHACETTSHCRGPWMVLELSTRRRH